MTWKKRIISIVLCLCALLCAASVRAEATDHSHPICGASHKNVGDHTSDNCSTPTWTAWNGGDITYNNEGKAYIYLSDDVTLTQTDSWGDALHLEVKSGNTLYLCLNGHSLKSKAYYAIYVSGTLVLCDCNGSEQNNGTISHAANADGSIFGADGIYVVDNAIFTMYGGTISNNDGRGVLVSGGTFTMYGGEISHNTRTTSSAEGGGGVWVKNYKSWSSGQTTLGNFAMYGGKICNNEIQSSVFGGGGVGMDSDGSFYMENGTITGNKCNNSGGGLDIRCKTITIKGNSTISGNTCGGEGGGIFAISSGESSITNCTISGNNATGTNSKGGGLTFQNSTFTLKGCTITDNKTAGKGGAICLMTDNAYVTLSSGLIFSGNQDNCPADESGNLTTGTANDVYLNSSSAYLRLADDFSKTSTAPIVVTTFSAPTNSTVKIAEGSASVAKTTDFTYGNDSAISIIAKTKADGTTVELLAHKHNYSTKKDTTNHWQECSICKDKKDVTAHQYNQEKAETGCLKTAATCTDRAVYYKSCVCGATDTSAAETFESGEKNPDNHTGTLGSWQSNDDGHWKEYSCCRTKVQEGTHNWNEGEVTTPATCTTPGERTYTCTACSATKTERIDATGHTYNQTKVEDKYLVSAATCTDRAVYYKSCVCGATDTSTAETFESGKPLGHTGGEATCTQKATCTRCNQEYGDPLGHDLVHHEAKTATCTAVGWDAYDTCTRCDYTTYVEKSASGHDFSVRRYDENNHWLKCSRCDATDKKEAHSGGTASCTAKAKCSVCGQEYGGLKAHDFANGPYRYDGQQHWKKCANCDATNTKVDHSGGTATCTKKAECEVCGQEYGDLKAHDFANGPYRYDGQQHWKKCANCDATNTKVDHSGGTATCTKKAECEVCGQEHGEKLAHSYTVLVYNETQHWYKCANCDATNTKVDHSGGTASCTKKAECSVCGQEYGGLKAHDFENGPYQYDGQQHWKKCADCDATDTKVNHSGGTASCTEKAKCEVCGQPHGDLKAHDFANGPYQYDGQQHWKKCADCDATDKKEAHSGGEATCTQKAVCEKCGQEYGEKLAHSYTVQEHNEIQHWYKCANCTATTEPVAHTDFTAWKSDRSGHWHECSTCGYKTAVNAHTPDRDKATETTPQLCTGCGYVIAPATHPVHTWVFVAGTPATCNAAGEREHYKCTCGRTSFKNGDAYDINEDASVLTIAASHTGNIGEQWHSDSANHWQEYTCCHARANEAAHSGGAATCTAQAVCQVCGKAYGPLAAHAWQPATCTAPKTCTACHVTDGAALGHDWGAWKVTTPATKDAPGVETRTCTHNSAHTETRSIPKLSTTVYTVSEDTKIAQIEAKVDGLDKILESDENKALVNDGKSVGVSLTVKNTASSGVSEKIKEKLAGSSLVGLRLELTVEKTVTANGVVEPKQTIHDAGVLLKTTITLPAELQGKSGYVVYRLHDENVHVLTETANENGEFISVSADKTQITICARLYSEYVIAYQTGGSSGGGYHPVNPTPVKATSANTGDAGVLLYGVTAALSLTGTAWLGAKSRKH